MPPRRMLFLIMLASAWMLTGCFQQAGESLQPAASTALPLIESTPLPLDDGEAPTVQPAADMPPAGPTAIPITVIAEPTETPFAETPAAPDAALVTPTRLFITPGIQALPIELTGTPVNTPSGLITPTDLFSAPASTPLPAAAPVSAGGVCTYTVQPGDNLYRIAINNNTTVAAMREANPELSGQNPVLQPGQTLRLPACGDAPAPVVSATDAPAPPVAEEADPEEALTLEGDRQIYRVQAGDTLFIIAQRFGTTVAAIVAANELINPDRLSIGQELVIP